MIKVDLVTGFLGSGKTTFIKQYAKYLLNQGLRIGIIENDYGAINVDMMLLQELQCDNLELEMVAGGCDKDCHTRRLKTKLIAMAMRGLDRVIVEPSGIFDVDEFFDVLHDEPLDKWYDIGNVLTIVDATLQNNLTRQSKYFLASQAVSANTIILSKVQQVESTDAIKQLLNDCIKEFRGKEKTQFLEKNFSDYTQEDYEYLLHSGYSYDSIMKLSFRNEVYTSLYFMNKQATLQRIQEISKQLFNDSECGQVHRIKGFIYDEGWHEYNTTRYNETVQDIQEGQDVVIVIGENLNKDKIENYWKK